MGVLPVYWADFQFFIPEFKVKPENSAFYRTRRHLHKRFVGQDVDQQQRQDGQAGSRHHVVGLGGRRSAVAQIGQTHGQGLQLGAAHGEDQRQKVFIPGPAEGEQGGYAQAGTQQGQDNPPEGGGGGGAVDKGRLIQVPGDGPHKAEQDEENVGMGADQNDDDPP
ncbi:hypothetical protein D3C76_1081480 [compost metagenome]